MINHKQKLQDICDESLAYLYDNGVTSSIIFINSKYFIRINLPLLKWMKIKDSFIPLIQVLDDAVIGIGFFDDLSIVAKYNKEDIVNDKNISNWIKIKSISIEVNPQIL